MKSCEIDDYLIGDVLLEDLIMFDKEILKDVYGDDIIIHFWNKKGKNERKIELTMDLQELSPELRNIFCGDKLRVVTYQRIIEHSDYVYEVHHRVKLKILGAEFIKVRPHFILKRNDGKTTFSAKVEVHAIFPHPLNTIIEKYIIDSAREELKRYVHAIKKILPEISRLNDINQFL